MTAAVLAQFHPRISYYEAAEMAKVGNMISIDPQAQADTQIRRLLESNFRPVISPMHDLMAKQILDAHSHILRQGELRRRTVLGNTNLRDAVDAESGLRNDPRTRLPSELEQAWGAIQDIPAGLDNLQGAMRSALGLAPYRAYQPLTHDLRMAAAEAAVAEDNAARERRERHLRGQTAREARDTGRLVSFGNAAAPTFTEDDGTEVYELGDMPRRPTTTTTTLGGGHRPHVSADGTDSSNLWAGPPLPDILTGQGDTNPLTGMPGMMPRGTGLALAALAAIPQAMANIR